MRVFRGTRLIIAMLFLIGAASVLAQRPLPTPSAPTRWVTDQAGILSSEEQQRLDRKLEEFEQRSGAQLLVYIIPTLNGAPVEEFTVRAAHEWGAGQAEYDNGLVLFIFPEDRTMRVEVGYGLEGAITDAFSSELIRNTIAPHFQQGDWYRGIDAGVDAIIRKIEHDEDPVPVTGPERSARNLSMSDIIWFLTILFIFTMFLRPHRGRGGCGGCIPIFIPTGGRGVTWGGGGGGFSGGGGGFGGFSGGGGGFGGGGATGSW